MTGRLRAVMVRRVATAALAFVPALAGAGGSAPRSAPAAGATGPPPAPTILSTALTVAEEAGVARMKREKNLTWQGGQLTELTRLLARAGRFDDALRLIDELDTPDRVKVEAFVPIVVAAIRQGDPARVRAVTRRVAATDEWTTPVALADIAIAMHQAGDHAGALRIVRQIGEPAEQSRALFELGRLEDLLRAAGQIAPHSMHVPSEQGAHWEADFGQRQATLVRLVGNFVDRGDLRHAHAAMDALAAVPDREQHLRRARALLAIARLESPVRTLRLALAEVGLGPAERLGDASDESDLYAEIAERLHAAGEHAAAIDAVHRAVAAVGPIDAGSARGIGTSLTCASLVRAARAERALGLRGDALQLLDRALLAADSRPVRQAEPAAAVASYDFRSMEQHERVEAKLRVAAELEAAGEAKRAGVVLAAATSELAGIVAADARAYSWRSLVRVYREAGLADRGIEILLSGPPGNADKKWAVDEIPEDEMVAGPRQRLWRLLDALPASAARAGLAGSLAVRLEADGHPQDAARLVRIGLAAIAAEEKNWEMALVSFAGTAPGVDQPGDEEQRRLLQGLLDKLGRRPVAAAATGS